MSVAILGGGVMDRIMAQLTRLAGAVTVILATRQACRRALAESLDATATDLCIGHRSEPPSRPVTMRRCRMMAKTIIGMIETSPIDEMAHQAVPRSVCCA